MRAPPSISAAVPVNGRPDPVLRVAAFTGSETISSRRFRVLQYLPLLAESGIEVREHPARFGSWPPDAQWKRPFWLAATVAERLLPVLRTFDCDLTLLQRELVSTLLTLEHFTRRPRVLDVDDAVWLSNLRAGKNFPALARMCDGVICGNAFIAENIAQWNANIITIPTAVDTDRFTPPDHNNMHRRCIGWSGLHAGSKYLLSIEEPLREILINRPDAVLRVVSDRPPNFRMLDHQRVDFIQWSPENEVRTIQEMSVGLMPIDDTAWSRGKCSYKMLLYMACGVPVVVSPYGMNADVLAKGRIGHGAVTRSEWVDAILSILDEPESASEMGRTGRQVIEESFSLTSLAPRLAAYLKAFKK